MIYQHLFDRVKEPRTVRAGLIGAGQFGTPNASHPPIMSISNTTGLMPSVQQATMVSLSFIQPSKLPPSRRAR
jgi:hypothetical protein